MSYEIHILRLNCVFTGLNANNIDEILSVFFLKFKLKNNIFYQKKTGIQGFVRSVI